MTFKPTHSGVAAIFRPLGGEPLLVTGNWDANSRRFGVRSDNADAVLVAYEAAIEVMERTNAA